MYFDNIKHKVINHEKAVELIDILWNYNEKINIKTNNLNNSSDEGWRESKSFITNQNILLHFKSLCFFMTKLDGNKLSTDLAFQRRMWSAYQELENKCKNQTTNSSHYQNLENPLYLLAYHSKNEICDSTGASMLDILSSCYKSKLTDDKKEFLIQCLEEYLLYKTTLDKIDIGYFIANSITSSWNPKDSISLDEMCYFFSVIPSDKLQDIFKESTFNWSDIQKFKKSFKDLNQNMPIEDMLSKILEIQMLNDTQQTNQIKGKVLKF